MTLYQADLQLAVAKYLRWMPDRITIGVDSLIMEGWAIGVWDAQECYRFLINGLDFDVLEWQLPSPDLLECFPYIPGAEASRFRCQHYFSNPAILFSDGMVRFNVTHIYGEHAWSYRTAWFLADPAREFALPSADQITRVIGTPDKNAFCWGGATIVSRFSHLLVERFGRPLSSFTSILDWGCGTGRLTRYLLGHDASITGVDIDPDMIQFCQQTLSDAVFLEVNPMPPTTMASASFDLVIGVAVLPHLAESVQDAWLIELQRLTRPGGLLLLSIQGMVQMALYRTPIAHKQEAHRKGFYDASGSIQSGDGTTNLPPNYCRDVLHSPDYIFTHWGQYFDVLDIIEAMAGNQDVVVLRRRSN